MEAEEVPQVLPILPRGPYISLGRVLDYGHWEDRDRFIELDRRIGRRPLPPGLLAARDRRIMAAIEAGQTSAQTAMAEEMEPATVRKVKQRMSHPARTLATAA